MKAKFEVGDKVKFLNQIGGGIVTKVSDDFVFVQDDTGFDIPMQPEELIRMADMQGTGKMFNSAMGKHLAGKDLEKKDSLPSSGVKMPSCIQTPEDEIKALKNQVANLKDQVAKLKNQLANIQRQSAREIAENILAQYMVSSTEAEVDLHIESLVERPADLTAHEAFEIQMHYFRTCMNHALANKVKKVVFIHGVGRGILKDQMVKELKEYDNIYFLDAPMAKYGVGATEVYFK